MLLLVVLVLLWLSCTRFCCTWSVVSSGSGTYNNGRTPGCLLISEGLTIIAPTRCCPLEFLAQLSCKALLHVALQALSCKLPPTLNSTASRSLCSVSDHLEQQFEQQMQHGT
jgi:hypothetical protein